MAFCGAGPVTLTVTGTAGTTLQNGIPQKLVTQQ
jgi:hypothetical protein